MKFLLTNKETYPLSVERVMEDCVIPQVFGFLLNTIYSNPYTDSIGTTYENGQVHIKCDVVTETTFTEYRAAFQSITNLEDVIGEFTSSGKESTYVDITWESYHRLYNYLMFLCFTTAQQEDR